ncbi:DUF6344 domain-containing protein [Streptomyces cylindrosporus]|uniref:DUF6344 domain-containing protein n=1 Tax=Streptomyces cylindrosporus TaxID=2927583 RepID=A0ABS9YDP1_9ACTN|nr:DUF6344 domain-containing protein [Streptomyces cylindrosporus]MCI3274736.1 DUF6344 domain-containing protein [Streptomyces cylindrosporus]
MAQNQVMKLWTAIVTAFLALCTALGLVTTTAAAAVTQTEASSNSTSGIARHLTMPTPTGSWYWSCVRDLPPTMKQRIRAEAHGKSPSCRNRPAGDSEATTDTATNTAANTATDTDLTEPAVPLQR